MLALPHLANCGRAGGHQKKGIKEEKHFEAPLFRGGPAAPAAHRWARRAGGLKEEYEKRRNAKQVNSAASGKLRHFYFLIVGPAVQKIVYGNKSIG